MTQGCFGPASNESVGLKVFRKLICRQMAEPVFGFGIIANYNANAVILLIVFMPHKKNILYIYTKIKVIIFPYKNRKMLGHI